MCTHLLIVRITCFPLFDSGEYFQTRCRKGDPSCTPCEERLPSCIGLPEGANAFPNRRNSEFYVKCLQNRTVAVEVCQVSLFDETTRACSNNIDTSKCVSENAITEC